MPTVYLVDASPYIFRAYYSIPPTVTAPDGSPTNAILGFAEFWLQILQKKNPSHLVAAFDGSLTTSFRNEIYPEYKANRALPPAEFEQQLAMCLEVTRALGIASFIDEKYEADDIIGTLATQIEGQNHRVVIVSSDKDLTQLVTRNVRFWNFAKDVWHDVSSVKKDFGVFPDQIVDLLALTGDSVDNIPGVRGIGPKTAIALLEHYDTIEAIYDSIESVPSLFTRGGDGVQNKLISEKKSAFLSKELTKIMTKVPISCRLQEFEYRGAHAQQVEPLFAQLGFERIQQRIPAWHDS